MQFIGCPDGIKGYKLCYFDGGVTRMLISRDVVFKEDQLYMANETEQKDDRSKDDKTTTEQVELELPSDTTIRIMS